MASRSVFLSSWKTLQFPHYLSASFTAPGQHEVGAGVVGPGARWAPLDGVDLLAVGLEVMNAHVLLHAPDLWSSRQG